MLKIKINELQACHVINQQDNTMSMQASILSGRRNITSHHLSQVAQATGHWIWHLTKRLHQLAGKTRSHKWSPLLFTTAPVPMQSWAAPRGHWSSPWYIMLCFDYLTVVNHCTSLLTERWVFSADRGIRIQGSDVTTIARRFTGNTQGHLWNESFHMEALVKWSHQRIVLAMLMWELKYCSRYSLAGTCKLNDVEPEFRLQHVLDLVGKLDHQTATVALPACGITPSSIWFPASALT